MVPNMLCHLDPTRTPVRFRHNFRAAILVHSDLECDKKVLTHQEFTDDLSIGVVVSVTNF